jgi:hypothetical protein
MSTYMLFWGTPEMAIRPVAERAQFLYLWMALTHAILHGQPLRVENSDVGPQTCQNACRLKSHKAGKRTVAWQVFVSQYAIPTPPGID